MALRILFYIMLICLAIPNSKGWAQIKFAPTATLLLENGGVPETPRILENGGEYVGPAPLEFLFAANVESSSSSLSYEWTFAEDEEFTYPILRRFDAETTYTFDRAGRLYVRLLVTDTESEDTKISGTFVIQISESEFKVPNAFSPNGDGINDIFKVQYKSLVRFNAVIFNRWGQKLYQWGFSDIDKGWDGTAHGSQVPAGVYFIVIEALGSDGVVYNHKGDINILR